MSRVRGKEKRRREEEKDIKRTGLLFARQGGKLGSQGDRQEDIQI
jgi:hypothetical protein